MTSTNDSPQDRPTLNVATPLSSSAVSQREFISPSSDDDDDDDNNEISSDQSYYQERYNQQQPLSDRLAQPYLSDDSFVDYSNHRYEIESPHQPQPTTTITSGNDDWYPEIDETNIQLSDLLNMSFLQ
jgi:hypothetical protein